MRRAAFVNYFNRHHASFATALVCMGLVTGGITGCAQVKIPLPAAMAAIVLQETPAIAPPPAGFDNRRKGIAHGKTDTVAYYSASVGNNRKMLVYTPPGYVEGKRYPVLYLMHGIGGDEKEWYKYAAPDEVLDNLYAEGKLTPMIVVFPNGRAQPNDRPPADLMSAVPAFGQFDKDLLGSIIPFMEKNYKVSTGRADRAIAGFSMGGGQSLNIGLANLNSFAWIGGFSSAPNTKPPAELIPNPAETAKLVKLLYLSCGDKDQLIYINRGMHDYLVKNNIPHIWQVIPGQHNMDVWIRDLYNFSQRIFK